MDDKSFDSVADSGIKAKKSTNNSKMEDDNSVDSDVAIDVATEETGVITLPKRDIGWASATESDDGREVESDCKDGTNCTAAAVMLENACTDASKVAFRPDEGKREISSFINNCGRLAKNCGIEARVLDAVFSPLITSFKTVPIKGMDPAIERKSWNADDSELMKVTTELIRLVIDCENDDSCDEKDDTDEEAAL